MVLGFIAAIFLIWIGYKLYKASKKQDQSLLGNIVYDGISFGYVKDGETVQDLQ